METKLIRAFRAQVISFTHVLIIFLFCSFLQSQPTEYSLSTCLTNHNLTNFTLQSSPNYLQHLHFSLQNHRRFTYPHPQDVTPLAVIFPSTSQQISTSVVCSHQFSLHIIVRSGGHSYESLSSYSPTAFVILDLSGLNRVTIDLESETAWVEGGVTLGELYHAISRVSPFHAFPAGSCPTVGMGGHVSGGGFGFLSRKYGLAADNIVDAVLVAGPEGEVMNRDGMGEEVFWAIRGGGGGTWGVVSAWKIQLVRLPAAGAVVSGFIVNRRTRTDIVKLVDKWQRVAPNLEDDFYLSVTLGIGSPRCGGGEGSQCYSVSAMFKGLYLGPKAEAMAIMNRSFPELQLEMKTFMEMSWIESVLFFSDLPEGSKNNNIISVDDLKNRLFNPGVKYRFKAKSDYVRRPISLEALDQLIRMLEEEHKGYMILDPYGGVMDRITTDSIAFPHRKGNLYNIQYMVSWKEEDDKIIQKNKYYINWIRRVYSFMKPHVSSNPRAAYVNYLDLDLGVISCCCCWHDDSEVEKARSFGEMYFLGNYERLVRAKSRIDPHNVFRHEQSIIPPLRITQLGTLGLEGWSTSSGQISCLDKPGKTESNCSI